MLRFAQRVVPVLLSASCVLVLSAQAAQGATPPAPGLFEAARLSLAAPAAASAEPLSGERVMDDAEASPAALTLSSPSLTLSLATLSFTPQPATDEPAQPGISLDDAPAAEADKSGTDPTKFYRTLKLSNEFQRLPSENNFNITSLFYTQPFADGRMNLRLKAPVVATDALGTGDFGLGDITLKYNWLADVNAERGLLFSAELTADSATDDVLGRGKWIIAPAFTYAMFLSPTVIFAPTYQHSLSFAGDDDRRDVNESVIDLYLVITAKDKKSWWIVDPTIAIDWENDENVPVTLEVEYGRNIGTLFGGALNFYVRPGVGIGQDRPYDWNVEVGFTVVGF
jgi:hypothetical protein